jgi:hypothetical protein
MEVCGGASAVETEAIGALPELAVQAQDVGGVSATLARSQRDEAAVRAIARLPLVQAIETMRFTDPEAAFGIAERRAIRRVIARARRQPSDAVVSGTMTIAALNVRFVEGALTVELTAAAAIEQEASLAPARCREVLVDAANEHEALGETEEAAALLQRALGSGPPDPELEQRVSAAKK